MPLPSVIAGVREIGDETSPYWLASTLDGGTVRLEADETVLWHGVGQIEAARWKLDDCGVALTDRRFVFVNRNYDKGGGWVGFGVGAVVAAGANAVSQRRAAERSAGKAVVGQVRHEWLRAIKYRHKKALIGVVDTYVDLFCVTAAGTECYTLWIPKGPKDANLARVFAETAAKHRLSLGQVSAKVEEELKEYVQGGATRPEQGGKNDLGWGYPGDVAALCSVAAGKFFSSGAP